MTVRPTFPIPSSDLELDKTGGGWVLTAFRNDVAPGVLRLRIPEYTNVQDPFNLHLEVRDENCTEFRQVGVVFTCAEDLVTGEVVEDWEAVPARFRVTLLAMAFTLGVILDRTELGCTIHQRYADEPHTSRDYFYFGAPDDQPQPSSVGPSSSG